MNEETVGTTIDSILYATATAKLKEEIEEELKKQDPSPEQAEAALAKPEKEEG